jgi:hypothetical protein
MPHWCGIRSIVAFVELAPRIMLATVLQLSITAMNW